MGYVQKALNTGDRHHFAQTAGKMVPVPNDKAGFLNTTFGEAPAYPDAPLRSKVTP